MSELEELKAKLATERARLWQAAQALAPEKLTRPSASGWSARDILAHVGFAERANVKLARLMVEQDNPVQMEDLAADYPDYSGPFTLDDFNAYSTKKLEPMPLEQVYDLFHTSRAETLDWLDSLTPEQLDRPGVHAAWGATTVRGMIRILALHDKMHAQEVRKLG